eukprot:TRINITY_DN1719_c0_g1_i3.p1 TRINITY_DN1719_c0_g1~~TRINITY_DN1719_c0_g1_i3.p1  ORF type:complete len:340 (+),score=40.91 TRINITY_DN1719_c0_g1_i3:67-1020(+)
MAPCVGAQSTSNQRLALSLLSLLLCSVAGKPTAGDDSCLLHPFAAVGRSSRRPQGTGFGAVPRAASQRPTMPTSASNAGSGADGSVAYWHESSGIYGSLPIPAGAPPTFISELDIGEFLNSATFGPTGTLYFTSLEGNLYTVGKLTGKITMVGPLRIEGSDTQERAILNGITYDFVSKQFWGVSNDKLYAIDVETPSARCIGDLGIAFGGMVDVAVNCDGALYGYNVDSDASSQLFSINKHTGHASAIGDLGFVANFGQGMSFDHSTGKLYLTAFNYETFTAQLREVCLANGASTLIQDYGFAQIAPFAIDRKCKCK